MIKCDTSALEKQLAEFHKEAVRKLEGMVRKFSLAISFTAIGNTPLGDAETYLEYYVLRLADLGLQPIEGFARGSWQVNFNDETASAQELYGQDSGATAESAIKIHLLNYNLGDDVIISNVGPYIGKLENNYSDQTSGMGIMKPTVDSVMRTYQLHLDDYYKKA